MTPHFNCSYEGRSAIAIGGRHVHAPDSAFFLGGREDFLSAIMENGEMTSIESHPSREAAVERAAELAGQMHSAIPDMTVREYCDIHRQARDNGAVGAIGRAVGENAPGDPAGDHRGAVGRRVGRTVPPVPRRRRNSTRELKTAL